VVVLGSWGKLSGRLTLTDGDTILRLMGRVPDDVDDGIVEGSAGAPSPVADGSKAIV
jgi:hypothetical protein